MKNQTRILLGSAAFLGVILVILALGRLAAPRIVGRLTTPDGVECCVLQRFNWFEDPFFTTGFVFRKPGEPWKWFYYNHEDNYWGQARMDIGTNSQLLVYRDGKPAITFDWKKELYTFRGGLTRDNPSSKPAGWSPETEGYR